MVISSSKEHILSKIRAKNAFFTQGDAFLLQMLFYTGRSFLKKPLVLGQVLYHSLKKRKKIKTYSTDLARLS